MRIVLADDHPLFRSGVRNLIHSTGVLEVVGEASNGEEAVRLALELKPDVIVMDIRMPGMNGMEATKAIRERLPEMKILIVTMLKNDLSVFTAMQLGARGYVLKDAGEMELLQSIQVVGNGGAVFSSDIAARMIDYFSLTKHQGKPDSLGELTAREFEILKLIAEDYSNPQIANRLQLSNKTVANYISNILNKLQVSDRHEAKRKFNSAQDPFAQEEI